LGLQQEISDFGLSEVGFEEIMEVGNRFTRLVLTARVPPDGSGRQFWNCDCDCGTKGFKARADKLRDGRQQSCGCLSRELNQQNHERRMSRIAEQQAELAQKLEEKRKESDSIKEATKQAERTWTPAQRQITNGSAARHESVKGLLYSDQVPRTDPLWSSRYYSELVADNECHFCRGPLELNAPCLDSKQQDSYQYEAHNVVVTCRFCMSMRSWNSLSFEEMKILSPALELIRIQRKAKAARSEQLT
jgi:hypothetical protein